MLTVPALATWDQSRSETWTPSVEFIGVFIPADRAWHLQLRRAGTDSNGPTSVGVITFTTHVLASFVQTLRDMQRFGTLVQQGKIDGEALPPLPLLDSAGEAALAAELANAWGLQPAVRSLGGISIALRARFIELGKIRVEAPVTADPDAFVLDKLSYAGLQFRDCISHATEAHGVFSGDTHRTWALLFDEMEIAPSHIQEDVFESLRGEADHRLIYKIAMAPFNKNFMKKPNETSAFPGHDFRTIELWYPEKVRAQEFSEKLVSRIFTDHDVKVDRLRRILGDSDFGFPEESDSGPYAHDGHVLKSFTALAKQDPSFANYLKNRHVDLSKIDEMGENERADKIRKIRSIVLTREFFIRLNKNIPEQYQGRSRKVHSIYTGYPTILSLCEGNPRFIVSIFSALAKDAMIIQNSGSKRPIEKSRQAAEIRLAANSFRAMLRTIPYSPPLGSPRSVLRLLDDVSDYFFRGVVTNSFVPQPHLSFSVDAMIDQQTLEAIGRALNAGAIIYVPDPNADAMLTSLLGKRFRLNYLLAAYAKLPIINNTSISLSTILQTMRPADYGVAPSRQRARDDSQPSLWGNDDEQA
jgi:hypothetical protein